MPQEIAAPGWWEWVFLAPSLALLIPLMWRGYRAEVPPPPLSRWSLGEILIIILFLFAFELFSVTVGQGLGEIPFLSLGMIVGMVMILMGSAYCLLLLLLVKLSGHSPEVLGLLPPRSFRNVAAVPLTYMGFLVPLGILGWLWLEALSALDSHPVVQPAVEAYYGACVRQDWLEMAAIAVGAVVLAPIKEELFFRGFIFGLLRGRVGEWWAVLLTSAAFALFHIQVEVLFPIFLVGLLLNVIYLRTGRLIHAILFHMLFNGGTLLWIALSWTSP